ncbi:MAG TPA: hypothetical protein VGF25_03655 [Thermoleophilaceae bacterium]|jgi:hypothetical protein
MPVGEQRLLVLAMVLTSIALLLAGATGHEELLAYAAPVLVLALPLVGGRYVGEDRLVRLASRARSRKLRPRSVAAPVGHGIARRSIPRGGLLLGEALAVRPPPRLGLR